ncbi:MAG TPA: hypothetical protein VGH33_16290, partial [Isosphaeraceae bacterium]
MHVEELRVGVDVGRQARIGVPHGGLGRPQGHASPAQEGAECRPKGMDVERPAPFVFLGDSGGVEVAVENLDEFLRDGEEGRVR